MFAVMDFKIFPLFFKIDPKVSDEMLVNVKFALLFGKMNVLKDPLSTHYNNIEDVIKVIDSVCPPNSVVGVMCDKGIEFVKVHSYPLDKKVVYHGSENDLKRFKKSLDSDKSPVSCEPLIDLMDSSHTPSTSTTPVKCHLSSLDDSGIEESQQSTRRYMSFRSEMNSIETDLNKSM